jgi:hypothetical protein
MEWILQCSGDIRGVLFSPNSRLYGIIAVKDGGMLRLHLRLHLCCILLSLLALAILLFIEFTCIPSPLFWSQLSEPVLACLFFMQRAISVSSVYHMSRQIPPSL